MIVAYERLGLENLQTDAQRVLDLNDAKGTFISDAPTPGEESLGQQIWEYLELEQN